MAPVAVPSSMDHLPADLLSQIGQTLTSTQLFKLFACGSKLLNVKLADGPLRQVKIDFLDGRRLHWPTFVTNIPKLESLEISADPLGHTLRLSNPQLEMISSKNLRTLKLAYIGASADFDGLFLRNPMCLANLLVLGLSDKQCMPATLPHKLTSLSLAVSRRCLPANAALLPDFMSRYLPTTLTSLALDVETSRKVVLLSKTTSKHAKATPCKQVQVSTDDAAGTGLSPQELAENEANYFLAFVAGLPVSLTSLELSAGTSGPVAMCPSFSHLSNLTSLRLRRCRPWSDEVFATLPSSLTSLNFKFTERHSANAFPAPINSTHPLPAQLRHLQARFNGLPDLNALQHLHGLQTLRLFDITSLDLELMRTTFSSLRVLHLEDKVMTRQMLLTLPKCLEELTTQSLTDDLILGLPKRLLKLKANSTGISSKAIEYLPRRLHTLHMDQFVMWDYNQHFCELMPPNLRYLCLQYYTPTKIHSLDYWNLPSTLEQLSVELFHESVADRYKDFAKKHPHVTQMTMKWPYSLLENTNMMKYLPSTLTQLTLTIKYASGEAFSDRHLSSLPPNLVLLNIYSTHHYSENKGFTNVGLSYLPSSLIKVTVPPSPNINEKCLPLLPASLAQFRFQGNVKPNWWQDPNYV